MARAVQAASDAEILPEADRLDGFEHPRNTRTLFGHGETETVLAEALSSGRLHHAWLLCGPEGIGKATLAYRFARAALSPAFERDPFGTSLTVDEWNAASRQVRAMSHPELLVIRRPYDQKAKRFAATTPVEEVRRLRSFLSLGGTEGGWRVVIVDSADELAASAANALLKSLEEPPKRTVFFLISSAPGRLLPTIRSRCRRVTLSPLSQNPLAEAVEQALTSSGLARPDDAIWQDLPRLSGGSVRRALSLISRDGIAMSAKVDAIVSALPKVDWRVVHALADELQPAAAEQKFELFFELLLDALGRLVRAEATGSGADIDRKIGRAVIGEARLATFAGLWETMARDKAQAQALNLDRRSFVLETFLRIEAASRS